MQVEKIGIQSNRYMFGKMGSKLHVPQVGLNKFGKTTEVGTNRMSLELLEKTKENLLKLRRNCGIARESGDDRTARILGEAYQNLSKSVPEEVMPDVSTRKIPYWNSKGCRTEHDYSQI